MNTKEYIYIVGAGGKTSLMIFLRNLFISQKKKCFVTTTTKLYKETFSDSIVFKKEKIYNGCCFAESIYPDNKISGFTPEYLDEFFYSSDYSIIVEADGAKMKPIKFPAAYEPVVSKKATKTILVLGLDALNKKINNATFHRLELFFTIFPEFKNTDLISFKIFDKIIDIYYKKLDCANFHLILNKFDDCCVTKNKIINNFKYLNFPFAISSLKEKKIEWFK